MREDSQTSTLEPRRGNATPGIPDPPLPFTGGRIPATDDERARVERRVMAQYFVAPALTFAALAGGLALGFPRLAAIGVAGLGLNALAIAAFALRERRLLFIRGGTMTPRTHRYFIYEGVAAVPYGLAWAILGASVLAAALAHLSGISADALRDALLARPHRALLPLGAGLACYGLGFAIGFRRATRTWRDRLAVGLLHAPALLGGVLLLALAAAAFGLGLLEWLDPAGFRRGFTALAGHSWPFDAGAG